jgi:hypothetical protein
LAEKVERKQTFFLSSFPSVFVRFSTKGVKNHRKKLFGENTCQKLLAEKVEKKNFFPFVFSHRFSFIAFLAVSLHEEPKNTTKTFTKIRPENLKKSQKR